MRQWNLDCESGWDRCEGRLSCNGLWRVGAELVLSTERLCERRYSGGGLWDAWAYEQRDRGLSRRSLPGSCFKWIPVGRDLYFQLKQRRHYGDEGITDGYCIEPGDGLWRSFAGLDLHFDRICEWRFSGDGDDRRTVAQYQCDVSLSGRKLRHHGYAGEFAGSQLSVFSDEWDIDREPVWRKPASNAESTSQASISLQVPWLPGIRSRVRAGLRAR